MYLELSIATILLGSVLNAIMYRMRGMNGNDILVVFKPRIVRRLGVGLISGAVLTIALGLNYLFIPVITVLMYYGIIVGHGSYFPRGKDGEPNEDNENFKFITKLIADPLNEKARFIGMAITGLAATAPVALIMICPLVGLNWAIVAFALSGALKAPVYWLTPNTEHGELGTGIIFGGIAMLPFLFI